MITQGDDFQSHGSVVLRTRYAQSSSDCDGVIERTHLRTLTTITASNAERTTKAQDSGVARNTGHPCTRSTLQSGE